MKYKIITGIYILIIFALFFYSYTQVDLGLTLIKHPAVYPIQRAFQYVGYFQRPISTSLYIFLLASMFALYISFLLLARKGKFTVKQIWTIIVAQVIILTFSYNAFSYDLFNYIFDAKIITHYHLSPYLHSALDFPKDPMLSFMHWTQRTSPYGPVWLLLTVPFSFLGFQYFLLTFFLFKILMSTAFVASLFFIRKILQRINPNGESFGLVLFGLNPLVVIESLVSSHIDIVSVALMMWSIYYLVNQKIIRSTLIFILSILIKYTTIFLVPIYIFLVFIKKISKKIDWQKIFAWSSAFMIMPVIFQSFRTNFQPWYLIAILPLIPFTSARYYFVVPAVIISFFSMLIYVPFLYTGNWNPPIPTILLWITVTGVVLSVVIVLILRIKNMLQ